MISGENNLTSFVDKLNEHKETTKQNIEKILLGCIKRYNQQAKNLAPEDLSQLASLSQVNNI